LRKAALRQQRAAVLESRAGRRSKRARRSRPAGGRGAVCAQQNWRLQRKRVHGLPGAAVMASGSAEPAGLSRLAYTGVALRGLAASPVLAVSMTGVNAVRKHSGSPTSPPCFHPSGPMTVNVADISVRAPAEAEQHCTGVSWGRRVLRLGLAGGRGRPRPLGRRHAAGAARAPAAAAVARAWLPS